MGKNDNTNKQPTQAELDAAAAAQGGEGGQQQQGDGDNGVAQGNKGGAKTLTLKPAPDDQQDGDEEKEAPAPQPSAADVAEAAGKIAASELAKAELAKHPRPGPGVQAAMDAARRPPMSGNEALRSRGEKSVTMIFPHPVLLTLNDHSRISFPAGTQEVPESLANHQYLRRNGVKPYKK